MKTPASFLLLGLALVAPLALSAKINRTVEKSFTVQPGGNLNVRTSGGNITVLTGDGHEVKVTAQERIAADSEEKADELLKHLDLTIEQQGNDVSATAKYGKQSGWRWGSQPVSVSFTVVVPKQYSVDLNASGGNIKVESINGRARLRTSGGNLELDRVDGEVNGSTSGGNIRLQEGTATVKLTTSGGDIQVDRAGGEADLSTSGGDISINAVRNRVRASTSGGDVTAGIEGALSGDCTLSTSGGNVTVTVDKNVALDLKAQTSGGSVDVEGLSIAIEKGGLRKSSLSGKVNGGGSPLSLGSSGGNIRLRAR